MAHSSRSSRAAFGGSLVAATAVLMLLVSGCNKSAETTASGATSSAPPPAPAPAVQTQINTQQQSDAAQRAAHMPHPK